MLKIGSLLSRFEKAYVKHVFRESNRCANALAKSGCRINRDTYHYLVAPNFIEELLVEDIGGGFSSREVFL
ncbi:unnamed protein product [Lathyrus sativus]|nr:unnamed protein product [Lathyrus sativus]